MARYAAVSRGYAGSSVADLRIWAEVAPRKTGSSQDGLRLFGPEQSAEGSTLGPTSRVAMAAGAHGIAEDRITEHSHE